MIDFIAMFENNLIENELSQSRKHGIKIVIPIRSLIRNENGLIEKKQSLPTILLQFYKKLDSIMISWSISRKNQKTINVFKEDKWLIDNYFNEGYEWGIIKEYLSGYINITKSEDIFNTDFCKEQTYYYTLSNLDVNQEDFFPLDIHWSLTACLKKENGKIVDNVWLVHTDAETIYNMKITIEEYLDLAYQAKGFHYWQLNYVLREKSDYFELMKRFLPKIVPHVKLDLSKFGIEQ